MKNRNILTIISLSIILLIAIVITISKTQKPVLSNDKITSDELSISDYGPDQRPSLWAWERRTFPYYKADPEAYREEMKKAQIMKSQSVSRDLEEVEFAGPTNIGGRVSDIEFNPVNPEIVYAGAATGGVFKSTDMGLTWTPVFDDQANLNIGDIGIDPNDPDIIYVGTGEANGGHNNFPGGGVYKSTDAGNTWELKGLENTVSIGRIVVDPLNSNRVFIAAQGAYFTANPERGVYRSNDGGETWENVLFLNDSTGAIDIVIDPQNPNRLIAAMWERVRRLDGSYFYGQSSGLYRSLDGGDSWSYIESDGVLPDPLAENVGRIGVALCASQPDIVYSLFTNGSFYIGLFKSTDFGATWTNADPDLEINNGVANFSWYFGQVRVHPTDPDIVFALDVAYMRSVNGGENWPIIYGYGGGPWDFHVDQHALAINPLNNDYIICGNDGGMNISTDGGVNFTKVAELPITQFYEIGLDRNNPQKLYGGTQDNGTLRTQTGGLNDWEKIYGGDGFYVIVDYTNPNIIYAESQNGYLVKSTNGGASFFSATNGIDEFEPTNWSTPVIMDPLNPEVLYYGTNRVYRTINGADHWTPISPDLTNGYTGTRPGTVTTIGVSKRNTNIIWAGTSDSRVWVSKDNGLTWTDVSETLPYRWVSRIIPDPGDENSAYVTFSGLKWADPEAHIFRTTDAGETWTDISSNLPDVPINACAVDHIDNNFVFVGTDLGAYYSEDKGGSWEYLDSDLPLVSVYDFKIHHTEHYLAIGTHARSMYKMDLTTLVGVDDNFAQNVAGGFELKPNYPNPFKSETTISFSIDESSHVTVEIFDMKGSKVSSLVNNTLKAGEHSITWAGSNGYGEKLPHGQYVCKVATGSQSKTQKIVLIK